VFLLSASEAMKMYKANPYFSLGPYKIPTWTWPIALILTVTFLMPNTSLIGHLCGALIGYGCKLTSSDRVDNLKLTKQFQGATGFCAFFRHLSGSYGGLRASSTFSVAYRTTSLSTKRRMADTAFFHQHSMARSAAKITR
jgi:hypothetical protein